MRFSTLPIRLLAEPPNDADTINHTLLVQAGFVRQLMAGVYTYLPFGLRVLNAISEIVREEMNKVGGHEIHMPALHPAEPWKKTGGWDAVDVLFKLQSRTGKEHALGQSHEEVVSPLMGEFIQSYKDLPVAVYQLQWKFRDELRSKSGILRGREFLMKDMYSFHENQADFDRFYEEVKVAYLRIFDRLGLVAKVTEASGGNFTDKISYEFMVLTDAGEDDILYCPSCEFCVNTEIANVSKGDKCPKCSDGSLEMARAAEVGNVFDLGQKFTKVFNVNFSNAAGEQAKPIMGCYGIGISRTMGVIVERHFDQRGIIWPVSVAPFQVHFITIGVDEQEGKAAYEKLQKAGISVLWDDRDKSPGTKFAEADLIGCPHRLVLSKKTAGQVEWKKRTDSESSLVSLDEFIQSLA